jgi:hypothetical protein
MNETCEVWMGPKQCGRPAPGWRKAHWNDPKTAYETERTRHRVCLMHASLWGRLYETED